jgi:integrative and conjugative element protein (TIGR02256 family)
MKIATQVYRRVNQGTVIVTKPALKQLRSHRQTKQSDLEACGVLLGKCMLQSHRIIVDSVTDPQPEDQRTRTTFLRSVQHQCFVDAAFAASGGTKVYLGEWHSHPEPHPNPSPNDLIGWVEKMLDDRIEAEALLFIIVGTRSLKIFEGDRSSKRICQLEQIFDVSQGVPNAHH